MVDPWGVDPRAVLVATFVGGVAAYLGSLMIPRKLALVGDALGHVALPGMGLALLLNLDLSLGALAFLAVGVLLIWKIGESTVLSMETLVGIVFVTSLALGFLIVPRPDLLETLIGDIGKLSDVGVVLSIVVSIFVFFLVRRIYPGMMLLNVSPELASVEGISGARYNLVFLTLIALIVALGVRITGSLLVGALVVVPPATARITSRNLKTYARNSALFGAGSGIGGVFLAGWSRIPSGPSIILVSAALFLLALAWNRFRRET